MNSGTPSPARTIIPFFFLIAVVAVIAFVIVVKSGVLKTYSQVTLKSIPTGALVLMDGIPIGTAPTSLSGVSSGVHEFRFLLSGYRTASISKTCLESVEITAQLEREPIGRLEIRSTPDGATVYIDGVNRGRTPFESDFPPGKHTVSMIKENYEEYMSEVDVKQSESTNLNIDLISSTEYYYKDQILADPTNLTNYADLMRFYYVKGRYEEMTILIFEGFPYFYKQRNSDSSRRFIQEITTIRSENAVLYNTKIFDVIYPHLVEYGTDIGKIRDACDTLILDLRNIAIGMPLLDRILKSEWDKKIIYAYITDRFSKGYSCVMRMPSNDFIFTAKVLLAEEKKLDPNFFYERLFDFGLMSSEKREYITAEVVWKKVLDVFPKDGNIIFNITAIRKLFECYMSLKKYKEGEQLLASFLERTDIPDKFRSEIQADLEKLRKNLQI